jgi:hypothetical protein
MLARAVEAAFRALVQQDPSPLAPVMSERVEPQAVVEPANHGYLVSSFVLDHGKRRRLLGQVTQR